MTFPNGGGTQGFDLTSHALFLFINWKLFAQLQTSNLMALAQLAVDLMFIVEISG